MSLSDASTFVARSSSYKEHNESIFLKPNYFLSASQQWRRNLC